jgi:hypothetical protein
MVFKNDIKDGIMRMYQKIVYPEMVSKMVSRDGIQKWSQRMVSKDA